MQCPIFKEIGSARLTSPFGEIRTRNDGTTYPHGGTDVTRDGLPATYVCPPELDLAKVTEILISVKGTEQSSGNYVTLTKIIDGVRVALRIKHMAYGSIPVRLGQIIKSGEVIGYMGNTGHSEGVHAHVELIYPGEWVDAYPWLTGQTDILGNKILSEIDYRLEIISDLEKRIKEYEDVIRALKKVFGNVV